jgi:hypothetical protein
MEGIVELPDPAGCVEAAPSQATLPDHLVAIRGGQWVLWKWAGLRGAGFPGHLVAQLAAPECAAAADELLRREDEIEESRRRTRGKARSEPEHAAGAATRRQLQNNKVANAQQTFVAEFQLSVQKQSRHIRQVAADERFQMAVLLQNRKGLRHVLRSLSEGDDGQIKRGFKERQNEELIACYLQRYCLKNDTIGFFGPMGWAQIVPNASGLSARPGPSLVASSGVYFENWCIESLAEKYSADPGIMPWIPPRLLPLWRLEGRKLCLPGGSFAPLPPLHAAILQMCNGERTARQIAAEICAMPGSDGAGEVEVYGILAGLAARNVISWQFELPYDLHPENRLRELLNRIEDPEQRTPALEQLAELERARDEVAAATGRAALDQALEHLDTTFTRLTGKDPTRLPGSIYAGRTLIYSDCQRNLELKVGGDILASLEDPLSLLLTSARWFSFQAANAFRRVFGEIHRDLARRSRNGSVELLPFWMRAEPFLLDPAKCLSRDVVPEFHKRWARVLSAAPGQRCVQLHSAEIGRAVLEAFSAPQPGWPLARYHSPDIMIAADSLDAIGRNDFLFVLGEMHITMNTTRGSFAVSQHPSPDQLFRAIECDTTRPGLVPIVPRTWPRVTNRTSVVLVSSRDFHLEVSRHSLANAPREQVLPISSFVVDDSPAGLVVRTRDGRLCFDLLDAFNEALSSGALGLIRTFKPGRYTPRILIDRLVIARESWTFDAADLQSLLRKEEHQRYLAVRRWRRRWALPRFVFVTVPVEPKPFYVDFDSPIYVEIFVKSVRRLADSGLAERTLSVSEMLPAPNQLWLPDAAGNTYAAELRIVARDVLNESSP